jgi:cupin superfamily acireductone dioxygenase involved in methionine salvage
VYHQLNINANQGMHYYRIKQVDKSGEVSYSNTVKLEVQKQTDFVLSPNPVTNVFQLSNKDAIKNIKIFNSKGQLVKTWASATQYDVRDLSAGTYVLQIQNVQNELSKIKMIKQ